MEFQILQKIKSPQFLNELIKHTELACAKSFWRICESKQTFRSLINKSKDMKNRLTKSNRISVSVANEFEEEMCPTLRKFNIKCQHIDNQVGDFIINGSVWELKTSKFNSELNSKNYTLQGATHSGSKCNNYIFIRYELDFDKILKYKSKPNNIIKGLHFSVHKSIVKSEYWIGEANGNNSRTTLKVPISEYNNFNEGLVYGSIKPSTKYLQFRTEPFCLEEYSKRINLLPDIIGK